MIMNSIIEHEGETFFRINKSDIMPEFFMTLVSPTDHWLFISSRGALTAGRRSPDTALFPYMTVDKLYASRHHTGPRTLIRTLHNNCQRIWEPFADWTSQLWNTSASVAKNREGSMLLFEESNFDLGLCFQYTWSFSSRFGFVRTCHIQNLGTVPIQLDWVDGLQNMMNSGITRLQQDSLSCLTDAYKDNSYDTSTGIAAFGLSALLTDRAEPKEALHTTVVWHHADYPSQISLDTTAYDDFFHDKPFQPVHRICGKKSSFILNIQTTILPGQKFHWSIVADTGLDHRAVADLVDTLRNTQSQIDHLLQAETRQSRQRLTAMVAAADGLNASSKLLHEWHQFGNVLFNIMRGGIPQSGYEIQTSDVIEFIRIRNHSLTPIVEKLLTSMTKTDLTTLWQILSSANDSSLNRLAHEYLPLVFSRRHGDPSRPWNNFCINIEDTEGKPVINYEGNWRDIFQNWEALAYSYPGFLESFLSIFLDATTLDGYNPYRITRQGIEWEREEPENSWSNIGYWNDHQIIYFQKLAEALNAFQPDRLGVLLTTKRFAYARVPYRIASYQAICRNPRMTITFDEGMDRMINQSVLEEGEDGRLVHMHNKEIYHGTLLEKILVISLTKISNLVPEGGIWLNTQRPEWNDANNALVGNGLSVVSTSYLFRFLVFWKDQLSRIQETTVKLPIELIKLLNDQQAIITEHTENLKTGFSDQNRRHFMDSMGLAIDQYRKSIYQSFCFLGFSTITCVSLLDFFEQAIKLCRFTLDKQRLPDGLYHAYNIIQLSATSEGEGTAIIDHLYPMLEGQVAILSSGMLSPRNALELLTSLRRSSLYREDQSSYLLYPRRELPDFYNRNVIDAVLLENSPLMRRFLDQNLKSIIYRDQVGAYHFAADIHNQEILLNRLNQTFCQLAWENDQEQVTQEVLRIYEIVFHHALYTGRSGTMYAYEGLGSIYWHMVAKLLLSVIEIRQLAIDQKADPSVITELEQSYLDIRCGIGYQKDSQTWGAFPWDPYSHTPWGQGAQQPGMTGQVKEEILTRIAEFGIQIFNGCIYFFPTGLLVGEYLIESRPFHFQNIHGTNDAVELDKDECAITFCQVPLIRHQNKKSNMTGSPNQTLSVRFQDGHIEEFMNNLPPNLSQDIFDRRGTIAWIRISQKP